MSHTTRYIVYAIGLVLGLMLSLSAYSVEVSTEVSVEAQLFNSSGISSASDERLGLSVQPRITHSFEDGNTQFVFEPLARWDSQDQERDHVDIRELNVLRAQGNWEVQAGIGKEFWGVTESNHLVDVINQTDALEGLDGEDKLGQPMLRLSRVFEQSTLSAYVLPGFREQAFLGPDSRFYLGIDVDEDQATFESDDGDNHIDYALRLNGYLGQLDYGLSWFDGTTRQASLLPINDMATRFAPYYAQMQQVSIDLQYISEAWLWKLEALHNSNSNSSYNAAVGGFEYTFYGLKDGLVDLGVLVELHKDSRADAGTVNFQNDLFIGSRLAFNDAESSELLVGGFVDLDDDSTSFRIEGTRRVLGDAKLSIEAQIFASVAPTNIAYGFRDNDYLKVELQFYF